MKILGYRIRGFAGCYLNWIEYAGKIGWWFDHPKTKGYLFASKDAAKAALRQHPNNSGGLVVLIVAKATQYIIESEVTIGGRFLLDAPYGQKGPVSWTGLREKAKRYSLEDAKTVANWWGNPQIAKAVPA